MAYTNETTHYSIPLPLGSDLTTPMDYNESMQNVDTALFEAKTNSGSALQKANQLQLDLATTNDNLTGVAGRVTTLEGTTTTQGQAIIQNTQDIADVRADALDMIVAKDEGTAQVATVAVSEGQYFRYNDVLYLATKNIAIGDTIVPNENCTATNVGTELTQVSGELNSLLNSDSVTVTVRSDRATLRNAKGRHYGNMVFISIKFVANVASHTLFDVPANLRPIIDTALAIYSDNATAQTIQALLFEDGSISVNGLTVGEEYTISGLYCVV